MNAIKAIVSKGFLPIINHKNDIYGIVESEANSAGSLLDGTTLGFVVSSQRVNAYSLKTDAFNAVLVTDRLVDSLASCSTTLINTEEVRSVFIRRIKLYYDREAGDVPHVAGSDPDKKWTQRVGKETWYSLFYDSLRSSLRFVVLHEIAHMHFGHIGEAWSGRPPELTDKHESTSAALTLSTYGGFGENRFRRIDELAADRAAGNWHAQYIYHEHMSRPVGHGFDLWLFNAKYTIAFLGILVAVLSRSALSPDSNFHADHPSFDSRLEWIYEGAEMALEQLIDVAAGREVLRSISLLRTEVEQVMRGSASNFLIRI